MRSNKCRRFRETMPQTPVFIDTNAFIQLKDLKDLPWRDLFPGAGGLDLMVVSGVITELDDFKIGTNRRRRDRSRAALKLIDDATDADDMALILREDEDLLIRLRVSAGHPVDWTRFPKLDPHKVDDQLVAEARTFSDDAVLFSHDRGPAIRAKLIGLKALKPLEDWHLPDEKPADDRKRPAAVSQSREPLLDLDFVERSSRHVLRVKMPPESDYPKPASPEQVRAEMPFLDVAPLTHQPVQRTEKGTIDLASLAVEGDWVGHQFNKKLETYLREYDDYFAKFEAWQRFSRATMSPDLVISNTGKAPASGIDIELWFPEEIRLVQIDELMRKPQPPNKPTKGVWPDVLKRHALHGNFRDPFLLSRTGNRGRPRISSDGDQVSYTIDSLKHHYDRELARFAFMFTSPEAVRSFSFRFSVTANELADPVDGELHVVVAS